MFCVIQKTPNSQTKDVESENLAILGSLSQLKEEEVVPSCVSKLLEEGYREQIMILQNRLLEMAYIKLGNDLFESNKHISTNQHLDKIMGSIHVLEVVNICRGPKNGFTSEW